MIFFWFKESFKLIGRAKTSFFLSLISMSISLALISAAVLSVSISNNLQDKFKSSLNINIFLKDTITKKETDALKKTIVEEEFIHSINYIDKEKAAQIFIKDKGADFRKLIDFNPLPASFTVTLKSKFVDRESIKKITGKLSSLNGVDEVTMKYEYLYKLIYYLNKAEVYIFILALVIFFISLYIIYSTIQLVINSKYTELNTMKLVGAKLTTIKMPIILNGFFIGVFSSLILIIIGYLLIYFLLPYLPIRELFKSGDKVTVIVLSLLGPIIGVAVSILSLRKITLKF